MAFQIKGDVVGLDIPKGFASVPAAPAVAVVGTAGTTEYQYQVVAVGPNGDSLPSAAGQTTTGNATLSGTNYNTVTWTAVPGAQSYRVLRQIGGTGGYELLVTTSAVTINDEGQYTAVAYTAASAVEANIGTVNIQITPGAGVDGSSQQAGFITVEASAALLSPITAGSCTLTLSQP